MKWYFNMSLRKKISTGFIIVAVLAIIAGGVGYWTINDVSSSKDQIANEVLPSIKSLNTLDNAQSSVMLAERGLMIEEMASDELRQAQYDYIDNAFKDVDEAISTYESIDKTAEEETKWNDFKTKWSDWFEDHNIVYDLNKEKDQLLSSGIEPDSSRIQNIEEDIFEASLTARSSYLNAENALTDLKDMTNNKIVAANEDSNWLTSRATMILLAAIALTAILALYLGRFLGKTISTGINKINYMLGELSKGHISERLNIDSKDEIGDMSRKMDEFMDYLQNNVVGNMNKISNGNLNTNIEIIDEKDQIGPALKKTRDSLKELHKDTEKLIEAGTEGNLNKRVDPEKFDGVYKDIIGGINEVIDVLVGHIDIVPIPVMIIDNDYNIKYMNKAGAEVLQKSQNQLIGEKCYENFKTGDCNTESCSCFRAMKHNEKASSKTKANPNGQSLDISYSALPLKDKLGETIGAFEFIVDETDIMNAQRLAEKQGKFQEKQVAKLVDNLEKLSKGNLDIHPEEIEADKDTMLLANNFKKINSSLEDSTNTIKSYVEEISEITGKMAKGNLDVLIDRKY
ncbi:MAG: MCP four helix bundle domain-containing protein, partial [bacterium]